MMSGVIFPESIKRRALEIGFDLVGIAPIQACPDLNFSREWVERGYGGEMRYLENPKRDDPRRILPSAQSVICVGLIYNADLPYSTEMTSGKVDRIESSGHRVIDPLKEKEASHGSMSPSLDGAIRPGEGQGTNYSRPVSNFQFPASLRDDSPRGWISRYAWGSDYHQIMRAKLEELRTAVGALSPGAETRVYVDTGPIVERAFARISGIGWMGKNTCLINESKGSWFFLGVILTSLRLAPDLPAPDRCGSCTRCIEACPTNALVGPYVMDASRCIAYLTIELKGSIPAQFRAAIGANVVGCDICQDVCPWNAPGSSPESAVRLGLSGANPSQNAAGRRSPASTTRPEFQPLQIQPSGATAPTSLFNPSLQSLASLSEDDFRRVFRRSPVKRVKYRGWLRNLCIAMGNSADSRFLPKLGNLRQHADPIIGEHAKWAIAQIVKMNPAETESNAPRAGNAAC